MHLDRVDLADFVIFLFVILFSHFGKVEPNVLHNWHEAFIGGNKEECGVDAKEV